MKADVVLLPSCLSPGQLDGRTAVVFDVLRATTTMTAALAAGVTAIHIFPTLEAAQAARSATSTGGEPPLLCGERDCLKPAGFDLGNSPGDFTRAAHRGRIALMATTNGTRAILAAMGADKHTGGQNDGVTRKMDGLPVSGSPGLPLSSPAGPAHHAERAEAVFVAALVNADAAAGAVAAEQRDVILLCAGTGGAVALEDVIGAGAVLSGLIERGYAFESDTALMALRLFEQARTDLPDTLRQTRGGKNVFNAGLTRDIDFAARLNVLETVGRVEHVSNTPTVVAV